MKLSKNNELELRNSIKNKLEYLSVYYSTKNKKKKFGSNTDYKLEIDSELLENLTIFNRDLLYALGREYGKEIDFIRLVPVEIVEKKKTTTINATRLMNEGKQKQAYELISLFKDAICNAIIKTLEDNPNKNIINKKIYDKELKIASNKYKRKFNIK